MAKFKAGQSVVFVGGGYNDIECILPKINEIVTIEKYDNLQMGYVLKGYLDDINGLEQLFFERELRALNYASSATIEILKRFTPTEERADTKERQLR